MGLPGREDSEPVFFAAAVDCPPPEVFCPWDDEDNCLELSMWVPGSGWVSRAPRG